MLTRPGQSALLGRSAWPVGTPMQNESTPLWVWLSVTLLAMGAATYAVAVYFIEYLF